MCSSHRAHHVFRVTVNLRSILMINIEELTDEQLEEVTGGCGYHGHHRGQRGGGHGHCGQGGYGYGGYQGPHINYNTQSLDFSQTTSLKESTTQYNVW